MSLDFLDFLAYSKEISSALVLLLAVALTREALTGLARTEGR